MKNIVFILVLLISCNVLAQKELVKDKLIADNFVVYDPPIKIKGARFVDEPNKPDWYNSYIALAYPPLVKNIKKANSLFEVTPTLEEYVSYKESFSQTEGQKKSTSYVCGGYRLNLIEQDKQYLILFVIPEINPSAGKFKNKLDERSVDYEIFLLKDDKYLIADAPTLMNLINELGYNQSLSYNFNGEFQKVLLENGFEVIGKNNRNGNKKKEFFSKSISDKKTSSSNIPNWLME